MAREQLKFNWYSGKRKAKGGKKSLAVLTLYL